jgi:hypothetical protein
MLLSIYVLEDELFMVWYKKGDAFETACFQTPRPEFDDAFRSDVPPVFSVGPFPWLS